MIVEMIAAQLRQNGHCKRDAVDPPLIQGMGGDFHNGVAPPRRRQPGQPALNPDRIGGGVQPRFDSAIDSAAEGAQQTAGSGFSLTQGLGDIVGAGGFAVSAGNADHLHRLRRIAVKAAGDVTQLLAQAGNGQLRPLPIIRRQRQATRRLPDHGRRAVRPHGVQKVQTVLLPAAHRAKQIARPHRPAVRGQAMHWQRRPLFGNLGESGQQLAQSAGTAVHGRVPAGGGPPAIFMLGISSGVMFRIRSASPIVWPNTGAATAPP